MGLHVAQMTSQAGMRQCFGAVTSHRAKLMHLQDYGLQAGCNADMVLLQTHSTIEALRLIATRLKAWKQGKLLASRSPTMPQLHLEKRPAQTVRI